MSDSPFRRGAKGICSFFSCKRKGTKECTTPKGPLHRGMQLKNAETAIFQSFGKINRAFAPQGLIL